MKSIYILSLYSLIYILGCAEPERAKSAPSTSADVHLLQENSRSDADTVSVTGSESKSVDAPDTIIFQVKSGDTELEPYDQILKVVYISDSSIWYRVTYANVMASGTIEGIGVDKYSHLGLESDEYEGLSYLAIEYLSEQEPFEYGIRINAEDSTFARITIRTDIATDAVPMQMVMKRVR